MPALMTLLATALALPPSAEDSYRAAADAFREGVESRGQIERARPCFARATQLLLQLHEQGQGSPELYLALGNAAFLAGRIDQALWAYDCGLQLDTANSTLRRQRDLVRQQVAYLPDRRPEVDPWLPLTSTQLLVFALAANGGFAGTIAAWGLTRRRWLLLLAAGLVVVVAGSLGGMFALAARDVYDREHPIVIVAADHLTLRRGNGPSYDAHPTLPPLPRGLEVRQMARRGAWLQVRLTSGEIGWLPAAEVLVVAPPQDAGHHPAS